MKINLSDHEVKENALEWQQRGLMYTATGYGRKIPTTKMVKINNRWRRIYCCIYSNSGVLYVVLNDQEVIVNDY